MKRRDEKTLAAHSAYIPFLVFILQNPFAQSEQNLSYMFILMWK